MSAEAVPSLQEALTARIAAIDGVLAVFPERSAGAVVQRVLASGRPVTGLVRVRTDGDAAEISMRLATSRAVPAREVVARAAAVIGEVLGAVPYTLEIEFSAID